MDEVFWSRVELNGPCWEWQGALDRAGYGKLGRGKKKLLAHRYAWEQLVGPIPEGLVMDHLCRNPRCVNPDHLEPVTDAENIRRGYAGHAAGRERSARTHCPHDHEFTEANTFWRKNYKNGKPYRVCRVCWDAKQARRVVGEAERERNRERERQRRLRQVSGQTA